MLVWLVCVNSDQLNNMDLTQEMDRLQKTRAIGPPKHKKQVCIDIYLYLLTPIGPPKHKKQVCRDISTYVWLCLPTLYQLQCKRSIYELTDIFWISLFFLSLSHIHMKPHLYTSLHNSFSMFSGQYWKDEPNKLHKNINDSFLTFKSKIFFFLAHHIDTIDIVLNTCDLSEVITAPAKSFLSRYLSYRCRTCTKKSRSSWRTVCSVWLPSSPWGKLTPWGWFST